ncbi:inorganic phosphate transporter pho86 [Yamadazyma tenuis]|uniref:Inorganic phosphate transporter PHO86 n=1 Tax=Candida tenuis (strain ATCC 10573 / BCRC 21748 / CBS 615 / JCM 9827 / NBRC 10315 / NRRL Y-1498 / VKM Y-70) TaxID=590646 RepID=G3BD68_CANTC|nr:uncharacterized protein CANTEDRAFT_95708 [Yamadazyma tenuis ATCC 10573]EGV60253.1 hypothetical protein CANTEDRAFT_95708 [Yamadazyma tenuis ATCC 10573]WEJ94505.1 inorganic phosphate transporter pho86 [Yamadazyma tenuis]
MAIQTKIDLNKPVKSAPDPKLEVVALRPEFSEAALLLYGDYFRQCQTTLTKSILWHKQVVSIGLGVVSAYLYYILADYIEVSESVGEFFSIAIHSADLKVNILFTSAVILGFIAFVGLISVMISDEFRIISENLVKKSYVEDVFGFDLVKYSKLEGDSKVLKEKKILANGSNSQVVLFQEQPIAIITLKPIYDKSNDSHLVIKVSGLSVRRVFKPLNFEQILIEWALSRSNDLLTEYLKAKKVKKTSGCKVSLLVDCYTFDTEFAKFLESNRFNKIDSTYNYNPIGEITAPLKGLLNKTFRSGRDTYGVHIIKD